jgi:type IV pilus assembly protein PilV
MQLKPLAQAIGPRRGRGVTMIEVLVALVVTTIGLLGIAKMQALAIASTRVSSMRSLISIEASSLASAMHANRVYWGYWATVNGAFAANVTAAQGGGTVTGSLSYGSQNCQSSACTGPTATPGAQMAAYDLWQWGGALYNVMPRSTGAVSCTQTPATATQAAQTVCTITVNWTETNVSMNAATQYASGQQTVQQSFTLMVQP